MTETLAVGRTEFAFGSADGASQVRAVLWIPADMQDAQVANALAADDEAAARPPLQPRGVVQLIHGMAEHIGRYDDFARFVAGRGYLVVGHDHVGHGETAGASHRRGVMHPQTGAQAMIDDVQRLRQLVSQQVTPDTPYFLFGHSMGSLVLRSYLPQYGKGLAGAVICGTANQPTAVSAVGNMLARAIARVRGADYKSNLLHSLADGAYGRAIEDARTSLDWLSRDEAVVDAYIADELSGFMFAAGAYAALTELAHRAALPTTYRDTPHDVPLLFVAGSEDPVGDNGRGVTKAAQDMESAGTKDLTLKLFEGMRHEILNEIGKEEVYKYIITWIEDHNGNS